jgi:hypothetical protein
MPVRENTPERAGLRSAHPVSRPHLCVESRESAGLFAGGLAVHCRDGLAAGAKRIRTIGSGEAAGILVISVLVRPDFSACTESSN